MKAIWCVISLLVINFVMEMIVWEAAPLWATYDSLQRFMVMALLVIFTIIAGLVMFLGISQLRKERAEGYRIRAF